MAKVRRIYWGRHRGAIHCTFTSSAIDNQSVVIVTASEGDEGNTTETPQRFVGDAPIWVENIAPRDGEVQFRLYIRWDRPLPVWTDIFIADEFPPGFIR
jgi:hypothetical protein